MFHIKHICTSDVYVHTALSRSTVGLTLGPVNRDKLLSTDPQPRSLLKETFGGQFSFSVAAVERKHQRLTFGASVPPTQEALSDQLSDEVVHVTTLKWSQVSTNCGAEMLENI